VPWHLKAIGTDYNCIMNIICVNIESFCATGKMCKICSFGVLILVLLLFAVVHIVMNFLFVAASTCAKFWHHVDCGSTFITKAEKNFTSLCKHTKITIISIMYRKYGSFNTHICQKCLPLNIPNFMYLYINLQQIYDSYCKTSL
jgi:hypothetical protein